MDSKRNFSDELRDIAELAALENKEKNFASLLNAIEINSQEGRFSMYSSDIKHYPRDVRVRLHNLGFATEYTNTYDNPAGSSWSQFEEKYWFLKIVW